MIHCIGDSHVYVFSGTDVIGGNDVLPFFKTYKLGSHTAYNVIKRRSLIEQIITKEVGPDDMIMFCFGEIDCRAHLLKQAALQKKSLTSIVSECADRYFEIFHIAKQYGVPLLAWNVPPSSREDVKSEEYYTYGSCKERNKATQLFNNSLQKHCEESGVIFVSIFNKLICKDGLTNTFYYLDPIHLSQKAMPLIMDELRYKGVTLKTADSVLDINQDTTDGKSIAHNKKKILIYCGINNLLNFNRLRPDFEVCYGFDANQIKVEQARQAYKNDPNVYFVFGALTERSGEEIEFNITNEWDPSSTIGELNPEYVHMRSGKLTSQTKIKVPTINLYDFCTSNNIQEIDTLITDLQGMDLSVLKTLKKMINERKIIDIQCETETDHTPPIHLNLTSNKFKDLKQLLSDDYELIWQEPEVVPDDWWEMDTRWKVKQGSPLMQKQLSINIVYEHLQKEQVHSLHRGGVSVVWSVLPLEGFDVYAYLNSSSFRGKQPGLDILMMLEPIVVLPGEYNELIWSHFDHIFTLCDALLNHGQTFTKILFPRSDWIRQVAITEDIQERVKKYPLERKSCAICMINGYKKSEVPSELYSKRIEAAKWFYENSDISFDVYGTPPFPLPNFKGSLALDAKLDTLCRYKYCLCFENTDHPKFSAGYITEKILDCFEARTIPIYLGSVNIEKYIPQECFIDFRKFADFADLNRFLHRLSDEEYQRYIYNIDAWVARGGLRPYSWHTIYTQLAEVYAAGTNSNINDLFTPELNWAGGISSSSNIKEFISVTASPLWTWQDLAGGTSQLLTDAEGSGTAVINDYVLHFQNIKSENGSLRIELLKDISHVFGLDTFIETGTYLGDTSHAASRIFQSVHTIELSTDLYQKAIERFKNNTNIHVYNGDSGKIFPELLCKIKGKALFWLDGHYSEGVTAKGDENTPIIKEIKAIKDALIADAVILIDDVRFFDTVWDVIPENSAARGYPSIVSLCNAIRDIDKTYKFAVVGDILMACPVSAVFDVTPVVTSCTISRLYDGTNFNLEQVMEAEAAIGKAQSAELVALQNLFGACVSVESYGLGKHYRLWHALILAFHEDYMKACKEFLMAMNLGSDHWRINWYLAKAAYHAGYYSLSKKQAEIVSMIVPDYHEAQQLLDKIEVSRKNVAEENVFSSQDRIELAQHYQRAAKYDKAINEFEAGILCDPDNHDIRYGYAKLCAATRQYEKAITELQKVLNLNLTYAPAHNDLGEIYTMMGDSKKALEHFKQAVSMDNRHYSALANIINILIKAGDFEEAANIIKPVLDKSPNDPNLLKVAEQFIAIAKKEGRIPTVAAPSKATHQETPSAELKQKTSEYYQSIGRYYQLASSSGLINKFVHPVWIKQLTTLGEVITAGLPDNFLLHPICLEMFVRAGWNPQQEYELTYIESLGDKLRNKIYSLKESSIGQAPHDCKKMNISVNTLGMLWYYARINEFLLGSPSSIVEFGGGFGSLSRIFKTLNDKSMTYTIIDLPEMLSLQYYFLSASLGQDAVAAHISPEEKIVPGKINLFPVYGMENLNISSDLFISTFAISETPEITQNLVCIGKNFFNAPCIYITGQLTSERTELSWQTPNTIVMSALHLRRHTAMNRFHIGNNYELMASQKMVNMKCDVMPEGQKELNDDQQKAQNEASYAKDACLSHTAITVVFSKDRAMQLDCTLRSFIQHCKDIDMISVKVLYTTSNASHENQYQQIKAEYPSIEFIREKDFKSDLLQILNSSEYILFLVDDNIFVNDFYVDHFINRLKQVPDAIGFSLRLGKNTTYCYMLNKQQTLPGFDSLVQGILGYDWTTAEYDFGYPLEVSSSFYRLLDILPLLTQGDYKNPNTLELLMESNKAIYMNKKNKLLCFEKSVAFCNPLNMVQTMWVNRAGNKNIYTPEKLSQMFAEGFRIDTEVLSGFTPHSCHQEIEFRFIRNSFMGTKEIESVPLISIMIISYNGIDKIRACIESIKRNTPESHEIVVVDNAKNDGSLDYVKTVPGTVVIANPTNIGYSPARAQAMSLVKGKYIVSLDDDTIVTKGWVSKFIKHAGNNPEVGIIGPRSNYVSGPQVVKNASYNNIDELETFAETWSIQNQDHLTHANRLIGFCMFISRKVIDQIGCIDPNFGKLFGFDDDDYSLRAQIAGFKLMIADDILIHHTGGPQGRGDKVYNELMLGAWEMFKEKWNLKRDLPYGSAYDITEVLSRQFDKKIHYSPPYERSVLEKLLIFQAGTVSKTPYLTRSEFVKEMTSIIIPVQSIHLDECLSSIKKYTEESYEIIFLDHGAAPKLKKQIMKAIKENRNYKFVKIDKRVNFTQSLNVGINESTGEYIVLLFDDVVVCEGWLSDMLECLHSSKKIGIVGAMSDDASSLQRVEGIDFKSSEERLSFRERNRHRRIRTRNIDGYCLLFSRDLLIRIGLFDEILGRDRHVFDDFCVRAVLEGYHNIIAGNVFVHNGGGINRLLSQDKTLFDEKWIGLDASTPLAEKVLIENSMEMARSQYHKGVIDDAVITLIGRIGFSPNEKRLFYQLAEILLAENRFQEALDTLKGMAAAEDAEYYALLGYGNEGLGFYKVAEEYVDQALARDGKSAPALNLKGVLAYRKDDVSKAEEFFRRAIEADPGYGDPYTNLGMLRWKTEQKEKAVDLFEKGFILSPDKGDIITGYYTAINSLERYGRAENIFREARTAYPENKRNLFLLIDILLKQDKFQEAMKEVEKAMVHFGMDEGILSAALEIRRKIGAKSIVIKGGKAKAAPTLSVCMIVKNEEKHLAYCLNSLSPVSDEMIVVDTGSTDKTKEIAEAFGAQVYDFEWINDFAAARNHSLSKARGDWILVMDADEVISFEDHEKLKKLISKKDKIAYNIITRNYVDKSAGDGWTSNDNTYIHEQAGRGWFPSGKVRLFPNNEKIRFENPIHELVEYSIERIGVGRQESGIPVHHYGELDTKKATVKDAQYYELGVKKMKDNGGDFKSVWELAVQAAELGKTEESIELWYKVLGFKQREAAAYFNLANHYLHLKKYEDSYACSRKAYALDPLDQSSVLSYAMSEFLAGDIHKTISVLEGFLKGTDSQTSHVALLAVSYLIIGEKVRGSKYLRGLVKQKYNCVYYLKELSQSLIATGNLGRAKSLLTAAIETEFYDHDTPALLAQCEAGGCN